MVSRILLHGESGGLFVCSEEDTHSQNVFQQEHDKNMRACVQRISMCLYKSGSQTGIKSRNQQKRFSEMMG